MKKEIWNWFVNWVGALFISFLLSLYVFIALYSLKRLLGTGKEAITVLEALWSLVVATPLVIPVIFYKRIFPDMKPYTLFLVAFPVLVFVFQFLF